VDRKDAERAQRDPNMVVTLYPIECNPRAHTAVALFNNTPEMIEKGYMSLLEEPSTPTKEGTNGASYTPPVYPHSPGKYYWIGHDLTTFVILPALSLFKLHGNSFVEAFEHFGTFLEHLFFWKDGTYEIWDPLPAWWLYHVYWPFQFAKSLVTGFKWSRINVSTTKMFGC
ncbi:putative O-methyltransferase, partial [Aureobasidium melanogenum]